MPDNEGLRELVWRHFRWIEPHEAVPVAGTEYDDPSGKTGARCANCGNGEAIHAVPPVTDTEPRPAHRQDETEAGRG